MAMNTVYASTGPSREAVDKLEGPTVIEFGSPWCGFCLSAQPKLAAAFAEHAGVRHIKVEDGRGRRLGRSYRVKLWPTLIFLDNGKEVVRLVRPGSSEAISEALDQIDG